MRVPSITAATPETQRRARGHAFYPPKADARRIPALGATEGTPVDDKIVHLHYFTGGWDWYIVEADPETGRAFGYVVGPLTPAGEWGYIDLPELERIPPRGTLTRTGADEGITAVGTVQWVVERDCWWDATTFTDAMDRRP